MDNCSSIFPRFVVGPRHYLEQALCGEGHPTVLAEGLRGQGRLVLGGAEGALQLLPGSRVGHNVELHGGIKQTTLWEIWMGFWSKMACAF